MTRVSDPRIPAMSSNAALADRRRSLDGGRPLVLLDNGKVSSEYPALFDWLWAELAAVLPELPVQNYLDRLLERELHELGDLADDLAASRPSGVVLGLCDWGVTAPTCILAAALERHGVPTALLATPEGLAQASAMACRMAPGLPIVIVTDEDLAVADGAVSRRREVTASIVEGLTASDEVLLARFWAQESGTRPSAAPSRIIDIDTDDLSFAFTHLMGEEGLGDGLPLTAPVEARVDLFVSKGGLAADDEIWPAVPPRPCPVLAWDVAVIATMAGCPTETAPLVYEAFRAMADPAFRLFQAACTTHPSGTLVLVSGPEALQFGLVSGRGCLGPGFTANATVGRAVALSYSFLLDSSPGTTDLTGQGSPAEFTYCCAENLEESPWLGLNADLGYPSETSVSVLKCEGPRNVVDSLSTDAPGLLDTFASTIATLGGNSSYSPYAQTAIFMNPGHARLLAKAGWTKADVRSYLFEHARNDRVELDGRGLTPRWPSWFNAESTPVVLEEADLWLTVVGGPSPSSQVAIPWGYSRGVTRPLPGTARQVDGARR